MGDFLPTSDLGVDDPAVVEAMMVEFSAPIYRLAVIAACANTVDIFERQGQDWIYQFRFSPGEEILVDNYQHRIVVMNGSSLFSGSPAELGDGGIFIFSLPP
jgi:hypothetical protein